MEFKESADGLLIHGRRFCRVCEHFCRRPEPLDVLRMCDVPRRAVVRNLCGWFGYSIVLHWTRGARGDSIAPKHLGRVSC